MKTGWWKLTITGVDELNDSDLEHISDLILLGYREGQIIQDEEQQDENHP